MATKNSKEPKKLTEKQKAAIGKAIESTGGRRYEEGTAGDKAQTQREKKMGGGMMKKKNYAKGGPARTKMANGGKMVKGPYS